MKQNISFFLVLAPLLPLQARAQTAAAEIPVKAAFEVASVKPSISKGSGTCKVLPLRLSCTDYPLDTAILWAYRLPVYYVQGMPSWAHGVFYEINATARNAGSEELSRADNYKLVLSCFQRLFEERFHLQFHREKQLRPGFRLVAPKGGAKLTPSATAGSYSHTVQVIDGKRVIKFRNYTMANVANALSGELGREVVDASGLPARYDFTLQMPLDETGGSLLTALGDFGLKLEAAKLEADIFVIDRLERPSVN